MANVFYPTVSLHSVTVTSMGEEYGLTPKTLAVCGIWQRFTVLHSAGSEKGTASKIRVVMIL